MSTSPQATSVVFIPALLCDEQLYRDVLAPLGDAINPHVLLSLKPRLEDSVTDIVSRAPARFALVGTSYRPTWRIDDAGAGTVRRERRARAGGGRSSAGGSAAACGVRSSAGMRPPADTGEASRIGCEFRQVAEDCGALTTAQFMGLHVSRGAQRQAAANCCRRKLSST